MWSFHLSIILAYFLIQCHVGFCIFNVYPKIKQVSINGEAGEPLFLTPLIESGNIKEARDKALVPPLAGAEDVVSYSGYFTVNKQLNSNLFFWFFPAEVNINLSDMTIWSTLIKCLFFHNM
jgi:vitellogenic carboxypeptidase-like protein